MTGRIFAAEVLDEMKGIVREPSALFFSVLMPVAFFLLFSSIFGDEPRAGVSASTYMLATYGVFGVLSVTLMTPGIGMAGDRDRGWLAVKRATAVPLPIVLAAKVTAALPYALGVLVAMTVAAAGFGTLDASAGQLLRLGGVLVLGGLPFALLSLAVGFRASGNASAAILNAILLPSAVASGLWMPLEILPAAIGEVATFLPTYHLAQLSLAQVGEGTGLDHAVVLAGAAVGMAVLAAVSYRHART